jgi:hypothetical protein
MELQVLTVIVYNHLRHCLGAKQTAWEGISSVYLCQTARMEQKITSCGGAGDDADGSLHDEEESGAHSNY